MLSPAFATDYQGIQPAALDQPRINAYISLTPGGAPQEAEGTFNIQAFFDTGASGILLSNETAGLLSIEPSTYNNEQVIFSDVGVAGSDQFFVSNPIHISLAKYHPDADVDNHDTYSTVYNQSFGPVRTQIGPANQVDPNPLLEGLDVFGIPLMQNKVVVMDPRPVNSFFDTMRTYVYNPGTPYDPAHDSDEPGIPNVDRHVKLSYANFDRFTTTTPSGAPGPTLRNNPFIGPNPVAKLDPNPPPDNTPGIKSCYLSLCNEGSWLLDTGAAASIISVDKAQSLNVTYDPAHPMGSDDPKLLNVPDDQQFQLTIGGIGGTTKLAGFFLDSMLIRTMEGNAANDNDPNHIRFVGAPVLVGNITVKDPQTNQSLTLDGVLGMNFFVASAFVTEGGADGFTEISNLTPGAFDWVVFDQPGATLGLKEGTQTVQDHLDWFGPFFQPNSEWDIDNTAAWWNGVTLTTYSDGDKVNFTDDTTEPKIRITEPVAPSSITFNNSADVTYEFRGQAIRGFTNIEKNGNGAVIFYNSNTYKGTTDIINGEIDFVGSQDIGDVNVHPGARVFFDAPQHLWGVHIADGSATVGAGRSNTIVTKSLDVSGTGSFDLYDNAMIIKVDPQDLAATVADVNALIGRGLSSSTGLISTAGMANRRLGVIRNQSGSAPIYSNFFGESGLTGDEVLVLYTVVGDLNLDGAVTISDFIDLAAHFNKPGTWQDGDVNYDGMVTISDFIDLAGNFNQTYAGQALPLNPADAQALADFADAHGASVPEPISFLLLPLTLLGLRGAGLGKRTRLPVSAD
ncbi:MAG TPA: dockerin type I repeat-containing protein [Tepidisphaeraceae bacterium]|nr:dockerin type I repeat-containing protein [Tepidisphaeraceae bacterium]